MYPVSYTQGQGHVIGLNIYAQQIKNLDAMLMHFNNIWQQCISEHIKV